MWEGELNSLIPIAWQVHTKLYVFPFNISTNQRSTISLSPHLLGCLVRDLNYGTWPVTEPLSWITGKEFVYYLSDCWALKKDCA